MNEETIYFVHILTPAGWEIRVTTTSSEDDAEAMCRRLNGVNNGLKEAPLREGYLAVVRRVDR